jgi:hypothetical protein
MAPRTSKGKSVANAPSLNVDELGDEFHEVYNDLLVIKTNLVATAPGVERKRLVAELGEHLVCDDFNASLGIQNFVCGRLNWRRFSMLWSIWVLLGR